MNTLKTTFFLAVLAVLFVAIGAVIGGQYGATFAFIIALAMNLGAYWFSDRIVLAMYRAKPISEAQAPEIHRIVRNLASSAQIPMPNLYLIDSEAPNAFATGRNPSHAAVAVTSGILKMLTQEELTGVLAHELAHVKHRDILIGTVAATIAGAISYMAQMGQWALLFGGIGGRDRRGGNPLGLVLGLVMIILAPIAALMVQMAVSRSREYEADVGGAKLCRDPLSLAEALQKIHGGAKQIPMRANPATAHLFIVSPLTGGGLMSLFSTHPPIEDRVRRLEMIAGIRRV